MTPARLQALVDVDTYAHDEAQRAQDKPRRRVEHSTDPAADLAALANM